MYILNVAFSRFFKICCSSKYIKNLYKLSHKLLQIIWDMNDARVVCRQLGFPDLSVSHSLHALVLEGAEFGWTMCVVPAVKVQL